MYRYRRSKWCPVVGKNDNGIEPSVRSNNGPSGNGSVPRVKIRDYCLSTRTDGAAVAKSIGLRFSLGTLYNFPGGGGESTIFPFVFLRVVAHNSLIIVFPTILPTRANTLTCPTNKQTKKLHNSQTKYTTTIIIIVTVY